MKTILSFGVLLFAFSAIFLQQACYTFSGASIPTYAETYYIPPFKNNALNSAPGLAPDFTEALKEKIRTQSRLIYAETDPDLEFIGTIVDFRVTSEAPGPNEVVAINRLTINTAIEYIDHSDTEKGWKNNFSFFFDFPSSTDLASIQDEAIQTILNQLVEDIFNKAFTNW